MDISHAGHGRPGGQSQDQGRSRHLVDSGSCTHGTCHGGDEKKALEAGCDDYDTKPVNFNRLLDKIGNLLGNG